MRVAFPHLRKVEAVCSSRFHIVSLVISPPAMLRNLRTLQTGRKGRQRPGRAPGEAQGGRAAHSAQRSPSWAISTESCNLPREQLGWLHQEISEILSALNASCLRTDSICLCLCFPGHLTYVQSCMFLVWILGSSRPFTLSFNLEIIPKFAGES